MIRTFALVIATATVILLVGCGSSGSSSPPPSPLRLPPAQSVSPSPTLSKHHHPRLTSRQAAARNPGVCDPSLWRAIYHSYRLHVVAACKTVTGKVESVRYEPDGDVHVLLKLPANRSGLLNIGNLTNTDGDLVTEIICVGTITQADAEHACAGHVNQVIIPSVGERIRISGTYVLDADHGWMEIHPVSSLSVLAAPAPPAPVAQPSAPPPPQPSSAHCTASVHSFRDYDNDEWFNDVYVYSNQPDKDATASGGGDSWSYYTNGSGYADIYLNGPPPGTLITVTVGGATCTTG
jgi:predicted small lipoprotein YifL